LHFLSFSSSKFALKSGLKKRNNPFEIGCMRVDLQLHAIQMPRCQPAVALVVQSGNNPGSLHYPTRMVPLVRVPPRPVLSSSLALHLHSTFPHLLCLICSWGCSPRRTFLSSPPYSPLRVFSILSLKNRSPW
jgi:hypothetical protein